MSPHDRKSRISAPILLTAVLSLAGLSVQAWADEAGKFHWSTTEHTDGFMLSYAVADSDVGLVWIACETGIGRIEVSPSLSVKGLEPGQKGKIVLSRPGGELTFEGEAFYSEASDLIELSGSLPRPKDLLALFGKEGILSIEVPGHRSSTPINRQAQEAVAEFQRLCPSLQ